MTNSCKFIKFLKFPHRLLMYINFQIVKFHKFDMDHTQRKREQHDIQMYLESKKVYHLFDDLLQSLCISKPKNPIDFLIQKLQQPQQKRIFIVGPPGFKIQQLALAIADSFSESSQLNSKLHTFSMGDQIIKQYGKKQTLAKSIEQALNNFEYVGDETIIGVVRNELEKYQLEKKSYIIEGFPKTMMQGLFLQRMNIFPTTLLIVHLSQERIVECCLEKLSNSEHFTHIPPPELLKLAELHKTEYLLNINKVKQLYAGTYYEIDATNCKSVESEQLLEQANRVLKFKIKTKAPKKPYKIIIAGHPCSGRTVLGHELAKKYGLVYVSTADLISYQIGIKSPDGEKLKENFLKGELVDEGTVVKLLKNRLSEKDCALQGFILEGYPKNATQLEYLKDLKIHPTLFVVLTLPLQMAVQRKKLRDKRISNQDVETITKRTERTKDFLAYLQSTYTNQIFKIQATVPAKNILESVCFQLEQL